MRLSFDHPPLFSPTHLTIDAEANNLKNKSLTAE